MANRRAMGGMGNRSGNRSYSQQPFQGNVNPWQGQNMSNNMNQQGLMNQLSNPQQIALALSSLLQPQQQQQSPPSLLSLNAAPSFNQDRDLGRFGNNRGWSDFRRPEPYNKTNRNSGGGGGGGHWRDLSANRNNNPRNNRGGGVGGGGIGNRNNRNNNQRRNEERKPPSYNTVAPPENDTKVPIEEEANVAEQRRDWKEEKPKIEVREVKKEAPDESTASSANPIEEVKDKETSRYAGIQSHLLHCFVCSKDMWDGDSFQKHVRGRAHKQMLDSLEESMGITVNILRETMRLAEEKKMIELNRIQRLNKKPSRKFSDIESHCNMCDFKFMGKIIAHRKSEGHQRLKRFLHPNCNLCSKEFPSRMEWVEHRLSPEHLRQLGKFMEEKSKNDGATVADQSNEENNEADFDLEPLMEESTEQENDFPIVEMDDDLHDLQNRIPGFRKTRALASKSLVPFTGFLCKICNTSFVSEEIANAHLRSKKHYLKFVEAIKVKYQKQQQEETEKAEAEAKQKSDAKDVSQEGDSEMYDPEEAGEEEQEGGGEEQLEDEEEQAQNENGDVSMNDDSEVGKEQKADEQKTIPNRPKRQCNVENGQDTKKKIMK